jgi:hypothetical protein
MSMEQSHEMPSIQRESRGLGFYLKWIFGVVVRGRTYLNLFYLLLAFPLGLFYFIFLVVGFSLGFSLLILLIGLLILLIVFGAWIAFGAFERQLAIWLLGEEIPTMTPPRLRDRPTEATFSWEGFSAYLTNPVTWTSLVYLFVKFPLGILSFVVLVGAIALTGAFVTAPITFSFRPLEVWFTWNSVWVVDTPGDVILAFLIGVALLFISLHVLNGLAWVSGKFARLMLGVAGAGTEKISQTAISEPADEGTPMPAPVTPQEPAGEVAALETEPEPKDIQPYRERQMQTHVKVLGWLYIVLGILGILTAFVAFVLIAGGGLISGDNTAITVTMIVGIIVGAIIFLISAPGVAAGIGLLNYQNWARILALILGIINLPGFPVGTALGAYSLWVLLQDETSRLFVVPQAQSE